MFFSALIIFIFVQSFMKKCLSVLEIWSGMKYHLLNVTLTFVGNSKTIGSVYRLDKANIWPIF